MEYVILYIAMALDTLPEAGRVLLLAVLLVSALCGFARLGSVRSDVNTSILLRKGALFAVLFVPVGVYVSQMRMPVYVDQMIGFNQDWPVLFTYLLLAVWTGGVGYHLLLIIRQLTRATASLPIDEPHAKVVKRMQHWAKRMSVDQQLNVICAGGDMPWHCRVSLLPVSYTLVLPAAARNWPMGVVDVCLLTQLAQIKNKDWNWALGGQIVAALFWPLPWVRRMVLDFAASLVHPSQALAQAAYRDPIGWQRDLKQAWQRLDGLRVNELLGLPLISVHEPVAAPPSAYMDEDESEALSYAERRRISA